VRWLRIVAVIVATTPVSCRGVTGTATQPTRRPAVEATAANGPQSYATAPPPSTGVSPGAAALLDAIAAAINPQDVLHATFNRTIQAGSRTDIATEVWLDVEHNAARIEQTNTSYIDSSSFLATTEAAIGTLTPGGQQPTAGPTSTDSRDITLLLLADGTYWLEPGLPEPIRKSPVRDCLGATRIALAALIACPDSLTSGWQLTAEDDAEHAGHAYNAIVTHSSNSGSDPDTHTVERLYIDPRTHLPVAGRVTGIYADIIPVEGEWTFILEFLPRSDLPPGLFDPASIGHRGR
jgi:hypothetical protein